LSYAGRRSPAGSAVRRPGVMVHEHRAALHLGLGRTATDYAT